MFFKEPNRASKHFPEEEAQPRGDSGLPSGPPGLPRGRAPSRLRGAALPSRLWVPVFFGMRVLRWGQGRGSRRTCDVGGTACHPRPWPLGQLFPGLCPDGPPGASVRPGCWWWGACGRSRSHPRRTRVPPHSQRREPTGTWVYISLKFTSGLDGGVSVAGWLRADCPGAAAAPGDQHSHVLCGAAFKTLLSSCDSLAPRVMAMETGARGPCGSCWGSGLGGACRLHYLLPGWVSRLPTFRAWAPCLPGDLGSLDGDTSQCRPLGGVSGHFLLIVEAFLLL